LPLERYIITFYFRCYKMKDKEKTKKQLIDELTKLRPRIAELEAFESKHKRTEEALRENEEKYYGLFYNSTDFIYVLDSKGTFVEVNRAAEVLTGYSKSELIGMNFKDYISPEYHKRVFNAFYNVFTTGKQLRNFPLEVIVKDGTKKYFEINVGPLRKGEQIIGFHGCSRDITEQKRAEGKLRESEEKYRTILDNIEEGYYEVDLVGNFTFFNDSLCKMLNYSKNELMGMNNQQYMDEEGAKRVYEIFNKVYKTGRPSKGVEFQTIRKDRVKKHGEISVSLIKDSKGQPIGFRGIIRDITERKLAEEKIKASLEEKEVMLREIHHRVKNNMQIMSSLLRLQSGKIKDKKTLEIFKTSQSRIRSMAFIHESLYQSEDLARIDFSDYTSRVTTHLFSLYGTRTAHINYKVEVKDVFLDINTAIPCGLIINELVTNSLKHAFPDDRRGEMLVKMRVDKRGKHTLIVKDTGIGFPERLDFRETETLGMQLVTDLAIQVGGSIKLNREGGTAFTIVF